MSKVLAVPIALVLAAGCSPEAETTDDLAFDGAGQVIAGEFVISEDLTAFEVEELGLVKLKWNETLGMGLYLAEDGVSVSALGRALQQRGRGATVESNRPVSAFAVNDPFYRYQWDMKQLDVETAWTYGTGAGVRVAVIDSGVATNGEDKPKYMVAGYDFVDDDSNAGDGNGHGTHVAGTIAQATNNGRGAIGVAPDAEIMPLRVLDNEGYGDAYASAEAIVYAADHGAKVINMSLGSAYSTTVEKRAVEHAVSKGVVIVAASGNEYATSVSYPAAYPGVIAVGASRYDGKVAAYSNGGSALDLVAPGGDMGVDQNGDGYADGILQETIDGSSTSYQFFEGTSMASPHVAGVAALLISAGARPEAVEGLLTSTAKDVGTSGWDSRAGYGLIQPVAALEAIDSGSGGGGSDGGSSEPDDVTPPEISGVGGSRSGTSLTLWWTTDEPATSQIEFEGYGRYGDTDLVTDHELRFTINSGGTYRFTLISVDAAGNEAEDGVWTTRP